jgi:ferric-dicitrate binding protein FerR (iron transport regulator)
MNSGRDSSSASIQEEAARWFTILHRGVMTLEERAAYEQWLADEAHRPAMAEMQRVWEIFGPSRGSIPIESARVDTHGDPARKIMVAAMCVISLGLLALSYVHTPFWTSLDWVTR